MEREYIKDEKIIDINSFESAGRDFANEFIKKRCS